MLRCFNPKADRDDFERVTPKVDSVADLGVKTIEGERNAEKIAAVPTLAMGNNTIKAKTQLYDQRLTMDNDSQRFVRELARRSNYRRRIAELVKEHSLGGEDGATHILAYINDSNHAVPSLLALRKAMEQMKADDLMMWASRYNLFVLWSSDRQHPWDSLASSGGVAATLEIGRMAGTTEEYLVMVDGQRIKNFEFKNSILRTLEPVQWMTPNGEEALVHLELRMSTFFGYNNSGDVASELAKLRYLGSQCHGIMWPAAEMATLPDWPVAPPIVAGKVNVTNREAALSPPSSDSLAAFAGEYVTYVLPEKEGYPATQTRSLSITADKEGSRVVVEGDVIQEWTFGPNNTLTFKSQQGFDGWLQFVHLPGSPIVVGKIREFEGNNVNNPTMTAEYNIYGESAGITSRLPPSSAIDTVVNEFVTTNLGVASTVLLADVLAAAERLWSMPRSSAQDEEAATEHMHAINRLGQKVAAVLFLEDLCNEGETTFMQVNSKGAILPPKDVDPNSTRQAKLAMEAARDNAEVTKQATIKAGEEATETQTQFQDCNATMATYKASQATWKAAQAGEAAGATEACANQAASEARQARTAEALGYALSAAQYYNEARVQAAQAALAGHKAAEFALRAVEGGIDHYARSKNFEKLKEIAEASGVATKAVQQAQAAAEGWKDNIVASRAAAIDTAKAASEHAQACFKHMRRVQPSKEEARY